MQLGKKLHLILQELGISDKACNMYALLLSQGPLRVTEIAHFVKETRTNTYHLINILIKHSLVEKGHQGKKQIYVATNPKRLIQLFESRQTRLTLAQQQLSQAMPALTKEFELASEDVGVYRFEGLEGLKRVYDELLKDRVTVNSITNRQSLRNFIGDYNSYYIKQRVRRRIKSRVIAIGSRISADSDSACYREVRYLAPAEFGFNMDLKITTKKLVLTTFAGSTSTGIIIIDQGISKNMLNLFEYLWKSLEQSVKATN